MTPAEKHRETACVLANFAHASLAGGGGGDAARAIELALGNAEREGMKRAAEICEHFAQQWDTGGLDGKPNNGFSSCMQARDTILSEMGR